MKVSWKDLKISWKIISLGIAMILLFIVAVFGLALPRIENSYLNKKREKIKDIVETAISVVADLDEQQQKGIITLQEAQQRLLQ